MKHSLLSIVLVALVAGAVGALCTSLLSSDATSTSTASAPAAPDVAARAPRSTADANEADPRLAVLVEALAANVERLAARVEELERRPEPDVRVARAPAPSDDSAKLSAALAPQVVQESVVQALEDIRAQERAKAEAQRQQRELERIDERLTRLNEQLGLSPSQSSSLRALMLAQNQQRDELERQRDDGLDREQRRAAAEQLRLRADVDLARILTPEQLTTYRELNASRNDTRGRRGSNTDTPGNAGQRNGRRGG